MFCFSLDILSIKISKWCTSKHFYLRCAISEPYNAPNTHKLALFYLQIVKLILPFWFYKSLNAVVVLKFITVGVSICSVASTPGINQYAWICGAFLRTPQFVKKIPSYIMDGLFKIKLLTFDTDCALNLILSPFSTL